MKQPRSSLLVGLAPWIFAGGPGEEQEELLQGRRQHRVVLDAVVLVLHHLHHVIHLAPGRVVRRHVVHEVTLQHGIDACNSRIKRMRGTKRSSDDEKSIYLYNGDEMKDGFERDLWLRGWLLETDSRRRIRITRTSLKNFELAWVIEEPCAIE